MKVATINTDRAQQLQQLLLAGKFEEANAQVVELNYDSQEYADGDRIMRLGNPHEIAEGIEAPGEFLLQFSCYNLGADGIGLVLPGHVVLYEFGVGSVSVHLNIGEGEDRLLALRCFECGEAGRFIPQEG